MTEFEITVNGHTETIHTLYYGNGIYRAHKLLTRNSAQVKVIETNFGDGGASSYRIKEFWSSSPYSLDPNVKQSVQLISQINLN